jgi:hypothetical protein
MDIYLSSEPDVKVIQDVFDDEKPVQFIHDWEDVLAHQDQAHLVLKAVNDSEFPCGLSFTHRCDHQEAWLLNAARMLSVLLSCRALYTGSPTENSSPYDCLVFDQGEAYQASDLNTRLAGDGDGQISLVRRLPEFDAK